LVSGNQKFSRNVFALVLFSSIFMLPSYLNNPNMKKNCLALCFVACLFSAETFAQQYWQQEVNYKIQVALNDQQHTLSGNIRFDYINNSPDALSFIWIHLWPNGYKDNHTALYKQVAADKEGRKRLKDFKEKGFIDSLSFTADGVACKTEAHPQYEDIVKLILPRPLASGEKMNIATPFHVKVPGYFSRLGHAENYYMISQWYPKPAVYDAKGWHEIPYLDQGEFYSEYGSFDVEITLPSAYTVAATGNLQTETELNAYKTSGAANRKMIDAAKANLAEDALIESSLKNINLVRPVAPATPLKTLHFTEKNIHDFAWFASKDFVIQYDTLLLPSGQVKDVFAFHNYGNVKEWYNSSSFIEDAVLHYSSWLGEYPYQTVKAVEGPKNQSSGGMEYPTVTMITSPGASQKTLDAVITHEVGHNWLYGILGSNERDNPWMDEGVNSYFQFRYEAEKYRSNTIFGDQIPENVRNKNVSDFQSAIYNAINQGIEMNEAIATNSVGFKSKDDYGRVVYVKTALWLYIMELSSSREKVDAAFKAYYEKWKFKHPYPEDFKAAFYSSMGTNMDEIFSLLDKKGKISN
jgi:hypothetical protein